MIPVPFDTLLWAPTVAALFLIFCVAAFYARRERLEPQSLQKSNIYRCEVCRKVYVETRDLPLARCPRCGSMNEVVKRRE